MKVSIERDVYTKIMHWVNASNFEVSGIGKVVVENGVLRVVSATLSHQHNTATETDISATALGKSVTELLRCKLPGEIRFWWHSHVNMGVFWSPTDMQAMKDFASSDDSWVLSIVFNKRNEMRSSYYAPTGCKTPFGETELFLDQLPTEVTAIVNPEVAAWDAEYKLKVTNGPKPFNPLHMGAQDFTLKVPKGKKKKNKAVMPYGLTQEDLSLFAQVGGTVAELDALRSKGFLPAEILDIIQSDTPVMDFISLMDQHGATKDDIMDMVDADDDIPVADRKYKPMDDYDWGMRGYYVED